MDRDLIFRFNRQSKFLSTNVVCNTIMATRDDYLDFKNALNDLKLNSKPLINFLTILAEEKIQNAPQIVRAIEERIAEARGEHVLPALYVLDSIVKNLRSSVYVQLFEARLPVLFANAFNKVDERTRSSMFKLRQTWPPFFTNLALYNLDTRTYDIDPAWPITAKVPDPSSLSQNIHLNPNFLQRDAISTTPTDQQSLSNEVRQQILRLQQDDPESSTFRTRTVNQPPISLAPPKLSELSTRGDTYHMIPIERMEQIRHETAHVLDLGVDGEQQSKIKKSTVKKKKGGRKRRPSARLQRRATALSQAMVNTEQETSSEIDTDGDENENLNNNDEEDDDDDEPFIIKQSLAAVNNGLSMKPSAGDVGSTNDVNVLFGNSDKDYRDSDMTTTKSNSRNLDADSIFEINSKCLLLAEQKYKLKELSSEEYQATLKLLQNILQSEAQRLTIQQQTTNTSLLNGANLQPSHSFQQQLLQFTQQPASQTAVTSQLPTFPTPPFPFPGFGNDAYRHAMQILTTVGAPSSFISNYNFLPYLPPLPPGPPALSLVQNAFQSQQTATTTLPDQQLFSVHQSPPLKRPHDENNNNNHNSYDEEDNKRARYDPVTGRAARPRNFDEENVAPVPILIDANINMLKKKYVGIAQQLYVSKYQCRLCGLRFTAKQKNYYNCHLDWHYMENTQEKDLNTTTSTLALSRRSRNWYPSVQEWTLYEENLEEQVRTGKLISAQFRPLKENSVFLQGENTVSASGVISCPATGNGDGDDDRCFVCHDPFENFFDDNREEWHLKDALRIDGKTYHPICFQDVQYEAMNENATTSDLSVGDASSVPSNVILDGTSNLLSDTPTTDSTMTVKTDNDDAKDEYSTLLDNSTQSTYLSSMSFVNLVETIFMKKEDIKPVDIVQEEAPTNGIENSTTISEEIPFLTTTNPPEDIGTTFD
ncbi:unnamed protein product [Adineta ricciae]|uniref:CID domain-containing protein n=2 Tax=Adineta ricciae TaxID=249248 RepID=A0A814RH00_ADIRI|nr:unnamed protein product [Adineta ricciae]